MEKQGIWHKVDRSNWVHGLVTVDKPGGSVRITSDISPLNKYVIPVCYPMPHICELHLKFKKQKVFSKLDFTKYFYNIALHPDSQLLTTTITPKGMYAYDRLPMGLIDSAAVAQKVVTETLQDCKGCEPYIDDIIIFGRTTAEHDKNLEQVLKKLNEANLRLNIQKCVFAVPEITFLGFLVSHGCIKPDPKNLQPIHDALPPTDLKSVQSFLGMINYYNDFLPDLAALTEPLRQLTRANVSFEWTAERETAFYTIKKMVEQELKLGIFDPECPTYVTTDASDVGIGAVLSQLQNGIDTPIAFGHHTLIPRERNYATNEREALAVVYFCEYWEKYLLGRHFTLRTDHQALTTLLTRHGKGRKSGKFSRWFTRLSAFDYSVEYRHGVDNQVADYMSRLNSKAASLGVSTAPGCHRPSSLLTPNPVINAITDQALSIALFKQHTQADQLLVQVKRFIETQWPRTVKQLQKELQPYFTLRADLSVDDDYILRSNTRIVVPATLQKQLLQQAHVGHPGIVRMKRKLRDTYWWPGMDKDIGEFIRHCLPCQDSSKSAPKMKIPEKTIPTPTVSWKKIAIDITGPFANAPRNMSYIVVVIDYYSKFPEILCTSHTDAPPIIKWMKDLFARYGCPDHIVSDNGPQFTCGMWELFMKNNDIHHERTPVYHPQWNGLVEVFNRYLKHGVQTFQSSRYQWCEGLRHLLFQFRTTSPSPTGSSPAELMFSHKARMPFEVVRRNPGPQHGVISKGEEAVVTNAFTGSSTNNQNATTHFIHRGPFKIGQKVRVKVPHVPKGQTAYPRRLKVIEIIGKWTYKLSDGQIWHAKNMRRIYDPPNDDSFTQGQPQAPGAHYLIPWAPPPLPRRSSRQNIGRPPDRYSPG